jgi:hypothetical protein
MVKPIPASSVAMTIAVSRTATVAESVACVGKKAIASSGGTINAMPTSGDDGADRSDEPAYAHAAAAGPAKRSFSMTSSLQIFH